jgi:two-component system sensor histidine kinase KdpD
MIEPASRSTCRPASLEQLDSAAHPEVSRPPDEASPLPATEELLAATAHELRLPLSHIKGFVSSLRRTDVTWDEETRREFLAEIDLEADRLAELVQSLLTARAAAGRTTPGTDLARTSPAAVVQGALHRLRGLLRDRPLRLDLPSSLPSVQLDASQMERVLANLIQNALKYSPAGTLIEVSARITDDGDLEFSVEDQGPGIPAGERARIFEPFFRGQPPQQAHVPGHGLGLAICQSIVLAHGGRMEVRNRRGGGARFSVFLPARGRAGPIDNTYSAEDRGNDPAEHSRGGRRATDAQAAVQQPQGERLRRPRGRRWHGGVEADPGAAGRPAAA